MIKRNSFEVYKKKYFPIKEKRVRTELSMELYPLEEFQNCTCLELVPGLKKELKLSLFY